MSTTDDAPSSPASSATSAPDSTAVPDIAPAAAAGPPSFANFDEAVILLCQVWNAAERDIKIAEQIDGAVIVPSINELRYAGRRFVEAQEVRVRGGDPAKADRYLGDAWFACLRARHDAIDASVSKIAKDLDAAVDSFGHVPIARGFPRFTELKRTLFDFHEAIVASRENRSRREAIYDDLSKDRFKSLVDLFREFEIAEPAISDMAEETRQKREADKTNEAAALRRHQLTILGTLLGLLATIVFGAAAFFLTEATTSE